MVKKIGVFFIFLIIFISCTAKASKNIEEVYKEQFDLSGANKLMSFLPNDTIKSIKKIGIKENSLKSISSISIPQIFDEVIKTIKEKSALPIKAVSSTLAVILLCAIVDSIDLSLGNTKMSEIMAAIGAICICTCIIEPIVNFILSTSGIIKAGSDFFMCFSPIMFGIMLASGQTVSASSYHIIMASACQIISRFCTDFLVPLMNTLLGISIMASVAPKLNLNNLCNVIYKLINSSLKIVASVFTALLLLQNLVSSSTDNISNKTAKLALSSFVPIVGSALGDAFGTVNSCLKLLKSGIGVFAIIAGGFLFLPIIIECLIWILSLSLCASVSDILTQGKISVLLRSSSKVLQVLFAIILSCIMVFIISTVIILLVGSGG